MKKIGIAWVAIGILLLAGVFWFVWPTPFEYTRKAPNVWRVNRFTGAKEIATPEGWRSEASIKFEAEQKEKANEEDALRAFYALSFETTAGNLTKIIGHNSSDWRIEFDNSTIEYFAMDAKGKPTGDVLYTTEAKCYDSIASKSDATIEVETEFAEPPQLVAGARLVQVITLFARVAEKKGAFVLFDPQPSVQVRRKIVAAKP